MSLIAKLVRPAIAKLHPYKSARSLVTEGRIFLDANEAPQAPETVSSLPWVNDLHRYPLPQPPALVEAFASLYNVPPAQVFVGRGSDEAIDVIVRTFCEAETDSIIITPPTYGMYEVAAGIQGSKVERATLRISEGGFALDEAQLQQALAATRAKILFLCSPNNPTGQGFSREQIKRVLLLAQNRALVVVDEAYREFSAQASCLSLLGEFPNLVVLRTLSKAWALAGLRCGVALGDPELIALLQKVRAPYPLPRPVIDLALKALSPEGQKDMQDRVEKTIAEREKMAAALKRLPSVQQVFPSEANFLLVKFHDHASHMKAAAAAGIIIRSRDSEAGLKDCIRLTIGTPEENELLLKALSQVPKK